MKDPDPAARFRSPPASPLVAVTPVGLEHQVACAVVAANLQTVLGVAAQITRPRTLPEDARIPARAQYNAVPILKTLARDLAGFPLRVGVTTVDLCLPVFSFVYGEALLNGRTAVVSTSRLGAAEGCEPSSQALLYERLAKVALHETAHALGVTHCRQGRCLMRFASELAALDQLRLLFCPDCERRLARVLREMSLKVQIGAG